MPVLLGRTVKNTDILFKIHPVEIRALGEELLRFCRVSVWILTGNMDSQTRLWRNGKLLQKALGKLRGASWRVYGCFWPSRWAKRVFSAKELSSWSPKIISHNKWSKRVHKEKRATIFLGSHRKTSGKKNKRNTAVNMIYKTQEPPPWGDMVVRGLLLTSFWF